MKPACRSVHGYLASSTLISDGMSGIAADEWAAGPLAEGTGGGKKGAEGP